MNVEKCEMNMQMSNAFLVLDIFLNSLPNRNRHDGVLKYLLTVLPDGHSIKN